MITPHSTDIRLILTVLHSINTLNVNDALDILLIKNNVPIHCKIIIYNIDFHHGLHIMFALHRGLGSQVITTPKEPLSTPETLISTPQ